MKPPKSPPTGYNPYALLQWLMDEERTYYDLCRHTGVSPRQAARILAQIQAAGSWQVLQRRQGRFKLFRVEQSTGVVQRLIRQSSTLVPAADYARLCGIDRTSVRDRILHGTITPERRVSGGGRVSVLIDIVRYPPKRFR